MTLDRRERRKRETSEALRLAALRLVDAHGLDHVTVDMITAAADVSNRTFFNHFPTKEDALLGPSPGEWAELASSWQQRPPGESAFATLRALLVERAEELSQRSEEMALRMRVLSANPALLARFHAGFAEREQAVTRLIAARSGHDPDRDLYPRLLAAAATAALRAAMDLRRSGRQRRRLPDLVGEAFDTYAAGLAYPPPPGHSPAAPSLTSNGASR